MQTSIQEYVQFVLAADPIEATQLGAHEYDDQLGQITPDWLAEAHERRQTWLARIEAIDPTTLAPAEQMDRTVALIDLKTALRRHVDLRVWERAPYWYLERLGSAFAGLINYDHAPVETRGAHLLARLQKTPDYLNTAQANLTAAAPPLHVEMGITAARGLQQFLSEAVPGFAATVPSMLGASLAAATAHVQLALQDFTNFLEQLHGRAQGNFACGVEHFDFLLKEFHLLEIDHRSLYEFGREQMAADKTALADYAHSLDPATPWPAQIEAVKDHHPQGADFLAVYAAEMARARQHCVGADLITLPPGESCAVVWLPAYLRAGAPLGFMHTTPPFADGLHSELLLTPLDTDAPAERQRQHMRDNCYAFARSITLHEIYPGHHTQKVHHKLATATSPMRRYFSSPLFVEGWGLYTEDLMEESGFLHEPAVKLFKLRNALWRSARVVIDSGLHTRNMPFAVAVALLCDEVHLNRRMAEGEVRRYTTHDNPTYPSAYLLGKTAIHALRRRWLGQPGPQRSLEEFHDQLLSYGSPPLRLVAEAMLGESQ